MFELPGLWMISKTCDFLKVFDQAWMRKNVFGFQREKRLLRQCYAL